MNQRTIARWVACLGFLGCAHAGGHAANAQAKPEPSAAPPPATLDESLARLKVKLAKMAAAAKLPNGAVGIVRDNRLIWFQGFGTRMPGFTYPADMPADVDENTAFRIGSITKTLTGVALLQLRDAGKISLDDPLSKYLPEAAQVIAPDGRRTPIRIRHLVTHTSGLPREIKAWGAMLPGPTETEMIAALKGLALDFEPGTDEQYSNYAMALAGIVVARASGEDYRDYMQRHVFAPLGMSHTVFDPAQLPAGAVAMGYERADDKQPYAPIAAQVDLRGLEACGGLFSTVSDLARFAAFELGAWLGSDEKILSRASRLESQAPASLPLLSGGFVGVDWQLADSKAGRRIWHNGGIDGYRAVLTIYPKRGYAIIALTGSADQEPTLWAMQDAAVTALEKFVACPRGRMGTRLQAAFEGLIAFMNSPSSDRIPALFSANLRKSWVDPEIESFTEKVHSKLGACPKEAVLTTSADSQATLWSHCEKWSARIDLGVIPETGLIDSWYVHWFDE